MDLHEILAKLTRHPLFKEWHEKNKEYFLAHAFVMLDEPNKNTWQIGFYNPEKEKMVTFFVADTIKKTDEQEVLKSEGAIKPLMPEKVKLTVEEALKKAEECFKEYKELPIKHFFIIQHTEGHNMFNITYFTQSLKTINIKIDSETGEIIKHSKQDLAQFA